VTSTFVRVSRLLRALGAAATLSGLLAGLPYALLTWAEQFRPQHLPDLDEITAWANSPLSAVPLLQLVYCSCWLLWAYLLLQTLREIIWHTANFSALLHEAGPDALALTARRTLAGLLVGAIALAIATTLRGTAATSAATELTAWSSPVSATAPAHPASTTVTAASSAQAPAPELAATSCTVQPGDTLWDLANRHLGNPLRWREIYELNELRLQLDGTQLTDPDQIIPGWILRLPDTAPAAEPPPKPAPAQPASPAASQRVPTSPAPEPARRTPSAQQQVEAQDTTDSRREAHTAGIQLPRDSGYLAVAVGTALSAAAVRRTLRRRRDYQLDDGPNRYAERPEETPLVATLRGLTGHRQDPHNAPGRLADLLVATRGNQPQGLLDLLANTRQPTLALTGPGADDAARALLASALTTSGRARLLVPEADATRLAAGVTDRQFTPSCRLTADLGEALALLEAELLRRTRQREEDPQTVAARPDLLVLLTSHQPACDQRLGTLLQAGRELGLAAVLLAGTAPPPADAVTYLVGANGTATLKGTQAEDTVRFFHLPTASAEILLSLIPEREERSPENLNLSGIGGPPNLAPPSGFVEISDEPVNHYALPIKSEGGILTDEMSAEIPESADDREAADLSSFGAPEPEAETVASGATYAVPAPPLLPISISLLGPLTVTVNGNLVTRGLTGYAGELLAYLATHPSGSTKDAILEAIWPDKDPTTTGTEAFHTAKKSIRSALRIALGATTSLAVLLQSGGLWRLDPTISGTDLQQFQAAARRAGGTDPAERLAAHRLTVELYHGELCEGMDRPWLTAPREDARRRVLNALGILASSAADPEEALALLECALDHDPYNEQLHLRLAQQHTALGRTDAVRRTQERLRSRLAEIDERPTAATSRAFQDLLASASARLVPSRLDTQRANHTGPGCQTRPAHGLQAGF
jgi:DNA-binding SARP family transcriptional activator